MQSDTVNLTVHLSALRAITRPDLDVRQLPSSNIAPTKTLVIRAFVTRTDMANRLLIQSPASSVGSAHRKPDRSLLRLIGQAHRCRRLLSAAGHSSHSTGPRQMTMAELARVASLSPSYFSRVLRLSFLAPDIKKMNLQGRQPPELTAKSLKTQGPMTTAWIEQRDRLGLT